MDLLEEIDADERVRSSSAPSVDLSAHEMVDLLRQYLTSTWSTGNGVRVAFVFTSGIVAIYFGAFVLLVPATYVLF